MEGENFYSNEEGLHDDSLSSEKEFVDSWIKDAEDCLGSVCGEDDDIASFLDEGYEEND